MNRTELDRILGLINELLLKDRNVSLEQRVIRARIIRNLIETLLEDLTKGR